MLIEIPKTRMRYRKIRCEKCGNFICTTNDSGYLSFRKLDIDSNGQEFNIKCGCGDTITIRLKDN